MDENAFDQMAARLGSRLSRRALGGMTSAIAAGIGLDRAEAKKKKKKKKGKKRPTPTTLPPKAITSTTPSPTCTPQCNGKICGPDDCGAACGSCGPNATCNGEGQCRVNGDYTLAQTWAVIPPTPTSSGLKGLALDLEGNILVVILGQHRIEKYSPDGELLAQWGSFGTGNGQFREPIDIAVDHSGAVFVTESSNSRVQKFRQNAQNSQQYDYVTKWGTPGSLPGQLNRPYGIGVDNSGHVFVSDDGSPNRILHFKPTAVDNEPYEFVNEWAVRSDDVAVDSNGFVYTAHWINGTTSVMRKYTADGTLVLEWNGPAPFHHLHGIAIGNDDTIYVVNGDRNLIHRFDPQGNLLATFNKLIEGLPAAAPNRLSSAYGLAVNAQGDVYASSAYSNKIGVFVPPAASRRALERNAPAAGSKSHHARSKHRAGHGRKRNH